MGKDLFNFKWVFGRPDKPKLPWSKQSNTNNAQYLAIPEVTEHGCLCCRLAANTVTCSRSGNERFPVSLGFAELSKVVHESKSHDSGEIGRRRTWSASSVTKPLSIFSTRTDVIPEVRRVRPNISLRNVFGCLWLQNWTDITQANKIFKYKSKKI